MEYLFQIANTVIALRVPQKMQVDEAYRDFLTEDKIPDVVIEFCTWCGEISCEEDVLIYQGGYDVYKTPFGFAVGVGASEAGKPYLYMPIQENSRLQVCYVKESEWWRFTYVSQIFRVIAWERILNRNHVFLLHASFIEWNHRGILFTAPSGTGKSTQAELWEAYEGAEIINGDRAALSRMDGAWMAYGLPLAGSSHIYKNKCCQVNAVVVLRQGKKNCLYRLKPSEAFRKIYAETTVQYWDAEFQTILTDLLSDFVLRVPVYMLECIPEKSAVDLLKKELE